MLPGGSGSRWSVIDGNVDAGGRQLALLDLLGLTPMLDRRPTELSGGQQQRVQACSRRNKRWTGGDAVRADIANLPPALRPNESEQSLGNKLTKSLHVLVEGGHLWPLAEQFLEPRTRSPAKEQRTKSGKEWSRVGHAFISIYTYKKSSFFR